jgi:hypothetical protein
MAAACGFGAEQCAGNNPAAHSASNSLVVFVEVCLFARVRGTGFLGWVYFGTSFWSMSRDEHAQHSNAAKVCNSWVSFAHSLATQMK